MKSDITEKILIKPKRKKRLSHPGEEHTKEYGNEKRLQLSAEAGLGRTRRHSWEEKKKRKSKMSRRAWEVLPSWQACSQEKSPV